MAAVGLTHKKKEDKLFTFFKLLFAKITSGCTFQIYLLYIYAGAGTNLNLNLFSSSPPLMYYVVRLGDM